MLADKYAFAFLILPNTIIMITAIALLGTRTYTPEASLIKLGILTIFLAIACVYKKATMRQAVILLLMIIIAALLSYYQMQ